MITKFHQYIRSMFLHPENITYKQKEDIADYYNVSIRKIEEAIECEVQESSKVNVVRITEPLNPKYITRTKKDFEAIKIDCIELHKNGVSLEDMADTYSVPIETIKQYLTNQ